MARLTFIRSSLGVIALGTALLGATVSYAQSISIVDELGRTTTLEGPIQRAVVLGSYDVDIVTAIGGYDRIVGVDRSSLDKDKLTGGKWSDAWNVAEQGTSGHNYEAIVAVDPDAVILFSNAGWEEAQRQLEPFGIPVIVATGWQNEKFNATVTLLGEAFGLEEGADKVLAFRQSVYDVINERTAGLPTRTVYYENEIANNTPTKGSGFYEAIVAGHGDSIFSDVVFGEEGHTQGTVWKTPIAAAEILNRDPDLIIREFGNNYAATKPETFAAERAELSARPGWTDLKAYGDNDVYVVNAYIFGQLAKTLTSLYVAAWLYPDAFADLDPDTIAKDWVENYLNVPFLGGKGVYFERVEAQSN